MGTIGVPSAEDFPRSADMVIVGGGVIGVATAFWAARAGMDVVCLERRDGLGTLTTAASEECFRAQFTEPENIRMMLESIAFFEHFCDLTGLEDCDLGLRQQGYLFLSKAGDGLEVLGRRVEWQRRHGLDDVELLSGDEVRRRFPFVGPLATAATYRARDGWLSTHALTYGLAHAAASGRFCLRTESSGLTVDSQGVAAVETSRGPIATRCAVLASGPFAGAWAARHGADVPVRAVRRHKAIITGYPEIPADAPMTIDDSTGAYWRPETGGGALGWALPEPPGEPSEHVPTDWTFPAVVLEAVSELTPFWGDIAERLRRDDVFLSAGQYPETPDGNPIIDACPTVTGLYLNVGYGGHGIMASPEGGRMLVDLVCGRGAEACHPFRLERFHGQGRSAKESMVI